MTAYASYGYRTNNVTMRADSVYANNERSTEVSQDEDVARNVGVFIMFSTLLQWCLAFTIDIR